MSNIDLSTVLAKWLKKAKLRDGSHSVGFFERAGTFSYRGFHIGIVEENRVILKWPASTLPAKNRGWWGPDEDLLAADPKFFIKLRKAFRVAMTAINGVSIDIYNGSNGSGGRQQAGTKQ